MALVLRGTLDRALAVFGITTTAAFYQKSDDLNGAALAVVGVNSAGVENTNADGSANVGGADGATKASAANPVPVSGTVTATAGISTAKTYSAAIAGLAPAAAGTDIFTLLGSATKTIRVTRIQIGGVATAAAAVDVLLIKRSVADTGGTSSTPTVVPNDSGDAAGTAVVTAYTANPTLGTAVGTVRAQKITLSTSAGAIPLVFTMLEFGTNGAKPLTLRGVAQQLAISWNGQTVAGASLNVDIEWIEE